MKPMITVLALALLAACKTTWDDAPRHAAVDFRYDSVSAEEVSGYAYADLAHCARWSLKRQGYDVPVLPEIPIRVVGSDHFAVATGHPDANAAYHQAVAGPPKRRILINNNHRVDAGLLIEEIAHGHLAAIGAEDLSRPAHGPDHPASIAARDFGDCPL